MKSSLVLCMLLVAMTGCQKGSDAAQAKRMPKPPPPPHVSVAPGVHITVEVDGHARPLIDAAKLAATRPDYQDGERRAWRLANLLGPAATRAGEVLAVTGEQGLTLSLRPLEDKSLEPVLAETRRGELVVAMVPKSDPFPSYHGQGGRLRRPGDPLPRIGGVTHIRAYHEPAPSP